MKPINLNGKSFDLLVIRHAESITNVLKTGPFFSNEEDRAKFGDMSDQDVPLTDQGIKQAQTTGRSIREWIFPHSPIMICHSPYKRTAQTAEEIVKTYPLTEKAEMIRTYSDIRFRERDPGYGFYMTAEEFTRHFPYHQRYWEKAGPLLAEPPGGESIANMLPRVQLALQDLLDRIAEEKNQLVIITHGRTLLCIQCLLEGWNKEFMEWILINKKTPGNCQGNLYHFVNGFFIGSSRIKKLDKGSFG